MTSRASVLFAASCCNADALDTLAPAGGDMYITYKNGSTVLHHAAESFLKYCKFSLKKILISYKCNINTKNNWGETIDYLKRKGGTDKCCSCVSVGESGHFLLRRTLGAC